MMRSVRRCFTAAVVATTAGTVLLAPQSHASSETDALAAAIAEAWADHECPDASVVATLSSLRERAAGGEQAAGLDLRATFEKLFADPAFAGDFDTAAVAAVANSVDDEALTRIQQVSECHGLAKVKAADYRKVLLAIPFLVLPPQVRLLIAQAPEILEKVSIEYTADSPTAVPADVPEDALDTALSAVGMDDLDVSVVPDPTALLGPRSGYTYQRVRIIAHSVLGFDLFWFENEVWFDWNRNTRKVSAAGTAHDKYIYPSTIGAAVNWTTDSGLFNSDIRYYNFDGHGKNSGYKTKKRQHFKLCVNFVFFFEGCIQHEYPYINLYGHYDGGVSPYYTTEGGVYYNCEPCPVRP